MSSQDETFSSMWRTISICETRRLVFRLYFYKDFYLISEMLAALGIMGASIEGSPEPPHASHQYGTEGVKGSLQICRYRREPLAWPIRKIAALTIRNLRRSRPIGSRVPWPMIVRGRCTSAYTQRNLFEILLNLTEIRLYSPFSD